MKIQNGETYTNAQYLKALAASLPKIGKTNFLIASALGCFPWQVEGGLVDRPENLHILTFDAGALTGVGKFLTQTCGAPKEALKYKVYNFQDDVRRVAEGGTDYDFTIYNAIKQCVQDILATARGVPVLHVSSLTGMAAAIERSIVGPPKGKGYSDASKWKMLAHQLHELQNLMQVDSWHMLWEAHIDKPAPPPQKKKDDEDDGTGPKESIRVSGEAGRNWAYNTEQVFKIYREMGRKHPGTKCDLMGVDTQPAMDFLASGRGFTENLNPREPDLAVAARKLGLKIGGWNAKSKKPAGKPVVAKKAAPVEEEERY